jgi:hypothetical protein
MGTPAQARKKSAKRLEKHKQIVDERQQIVRKREQIVDELLSQQNREILERALDLYYEREYFAKEILPFISLDPREFEARLRARDRAGRKQSANGRSPHLEPPKAPGA